MVPSAFQCNIFLLLPLSYQFSTVFVHLNSQLRIARCILQEDTSAVETANQSFENEVQLKSRERTSYEPVPPETRYLDKAEDSGKMRQESDLVLELAVDKSEDLLGVEKRKIKSTLEAHIRASPRHRERSNDELSDYGSADIDEITKAK